MYCDGPTASEEVGDPSGTGGSAVARRIAEDRAKAANETWRKARRQPEIATRARSSRGTLPAFELVNAFKEAVSTPTAAWTWLPSSLGDIDRARQLTDRCRALTLRISLLTAAHRNPQSRWEPNDIFDFDALS